MIPEKNRPLILCVDDEPQVLEGLTLHLRRRYDVITATSGADALQILAEKRHVAVVMSDMKMPVMDGAAFLAQARKLVPNAARILLTGQTNIDSAIAAVNEGQIFRFLIKPCPPTPLLAAVDAAFEHHRLITAEKILLEQTLHGSIKTMTEVLALTNPVSFGRATRVKQLATDLGTRLGMDHLWQVEMAAMLRQLGYVTLPQETVEKWYYGQPLSDHEKQMVAKVPEVTEQLLANIPRLEIIREIIAGSSPDSSRGGTQPGAKLLRVAIDFDALEAQGIGAEQALATLQGRPGRYDPKILQTLLELRGGEKPLDEVREVALSGLRLGMILAEDLKAPSGFLIAASGYLITATFLQRALNFQPGTVQEPIRVIIRAADKQKPTGMTSALPTAR
jgi:response regulator RpfG family c-di-GMP phosphodiesterase